MDDLPLIPIELLEVLEKRYPNQAPRLSDEERFIWFKAGQVELVKHLRATYEMQTENKLGA